MKIEGLEGYYVVTTREGVPFEWSIGITEKVSKKNYAKGMGCSDGEEVKMAWIEAKKRGHKIVKVNISFEILEK